MPRKWALAGRFHFQRLAARVCAGDSQGLHRLSRALCLPCQRPSTPSARKAGSSLLPSKFLPATDIGGPFSGEQLDSGVTAAAVENQGESVEGLGHQCSPGKGCGCPEAPGACSSRESRPGFASGLAEKVFPPPGATEVESA